MFIVNVVIFIAFNMAVIGCVIGLKRLVSGHTIEHGDKLDRVELRIDRNE